MKKVKVLLIRLLPFITLITFLMDYISAFYGIYLSDLFYQVFDLSILPVLVLWVVTECESHYHCIYMRLSYGTVLSCETASAVDSQFNIFPEAIYALYAFAVIVSVSLIILSCCSIAHFVKATRLHYK